MAESTTAAEQLGIGARLLRLAGAAAGALAAAVSLIVFPGGLPWMIAFWLVLFSILAIRRRPAWIPLVVCVGVLLAKGVGFSPGLAAVLTVMLVSVVLRLAGVGVRQAPRQRQITIAQVAVVWLAWAFLVMDIHQATHSSRRPAFDPQRPIVCLGDSLTAYGYPEVLDAMLAARVLNRGRDGITTAAALELLPAILAEQPQAVVIELGGHDYLKGYAREKTRANLEQLITACRSAGAEVVLVEIPRGLIYDRFHSVERELARRRDLELVTDTPIRCLVLGSPYGPPGMWLSKERQLSDDGLHPNDNGNRVLAASVATALARLFDANALTSGLP